MMPCASPRAESPKKIHKDGGGGGSCASTFEAATTLNIRDMEIASNDAEPRAGGAGDPDDAKDKRSLSTFSLGPTVLDLTHHGRDEGKSSWVSGACASQA